MIPSLPLTQRSSPTPTKPWRIISFSLPIKLVMTFTNTFFLFWPTYRKSISTSFPSIIECNITILSFITKTKLTESTPSRSNVMKITLIISLRLLKVKCKVISTSSSVIILSSKSTFPSKIVILISPSSLSPLYF